MIDKGHQVGLDYDIDWSERKKQKYFDNYKEQGKNGFSGYEAKQTANKMLGAGLDDFMDEIILCEGSHDDNFNKEFDANIFNIIFFGSGCYFVSAGGGNIPKNSYLAKQIARKVFDGAVKKIIKDSDLKTENEKIIEISKYKAEGFDLF